MADKVTFTKSSGWKLEPKRIFLYFIVSKHQSAALAMVELPHVCQTGPLCLLGVPGVSCLAHFIPQCDQT